MINNNRTLLFVLSLFLILAATLFPFYPLSGVKNIGKGHVLSIGWGRSDRLDIFVNILLYVPFGFGMAGLLTQKRGCSRLSTTLINLICSVALSYLIETIQVFMPTREPSLIDVLSNSTGSFMGFFGYFIWQLKDLEFGLLGFAALAFVISIPLQSTTRLSNWDQSFSLLVGNEKTGNRPWRGTISELALGNRALSAKQAAEACLSAPPNWGNSLFAYYRPNDHGSTCDEMNCLPVLVWRTKTRKISAGEAVLQDPDRWLETSEPATALTKRIEETSQFTLSVRAATGDTAQKGPARIVSLSSDTGKRNFTLGQTGSDLVFRLRTPSSGHNGVPPELIFANVFATTKLQHLILTYDGSNLVLYVDGVRSTHVFQLAPGAAAFNFFSRPSAWVLQLLNLSYNALIFVPLGIASSSVVERINRGLAANILIISGTILLPSILLELALATVSGRPVCVQSAFAGMVMTAGTIIFSVSRGSRKTHALKISPSH